MRKYYWYASAFVKKHGLVVLASVVVGILVITGFLTFGLQIFEYKPRVYVGVVGRYTLNTLPKPILMELSRGLTKLTADGTPVPDVAERWDIENDGKAYRFLLKKNLFWQDGKPLSPADITYQLRDVQVITSNNDIVFKLNDAFVPFPITVTQPIVRVVQAPYLFFFKKQKLIGLGEYQLVSYKEKGQSLTEVVLDGKKERHIYRFYLTEEDAVNGFKRGEVDELRNFSATYGLEKWPNVLVNKRLDKQTYLGVFFNSEVGLLGSNELRQALNYALPKPDDESRAVGPISPNSWAFANVGKTYDFNQSRGIERLLSPNGQPRTPIEFELTTTPNFLPEAETLQKTWQEFGLKAAAACNIDKDIKEKKFCENMKLKITLRVTNFPDVNNYQALLIGQESPTDPDQYSLWHSSQQTNFTKYNNTRIDSLLEKGRQTEDQKKRFEIYSDFQQFFSEDTPVIFIRHLNKYDLRRS